MTSKDFDVLRPRVYDVSQLALRTSRKWGEEGFGATISRPEGVLSKVNFRELSRAHYPDAARVRPSLLSVVRRLTS